MHARQRTAIKLIILALVCFILRWPLDDFMCNPALWHGQEKNAQGHFILWREPEKTASGKDLFSEVLSGGAGTPAMFALLGGQRYLVANILWNYADVLFHKGDPYRMVSAFDSCVSLNPAFTEAWSTYGWHEAWNLFDDAKTITEKEKWLYYGIKVYERAIEAQPGKPHALFDLGWLYLERVGDYFKAKDQFAQVVEGTKFQPLYVQDKKQLGNALDLYNEKRWDPTLYGLRLGYVYRLLGVITADKQYFHQALATYNKCLEIDPGCKDAIRLKKEITENMDKPSWLKKEQKMDAAIRKNYEMAPLHYGYPGKTMDEMITGTSDAQQLQVSPL